MSDVVIGDILPYTQAIATAGQTVFGTNWTANAASDVVVYYTPVGTPPNDATQILSYPSQYSVAFIGGSQQVQVTLVTPAVNNGDIVTITRETPADYLNLYTNTNFTPSMLNNDFSILTLVDQQAQLVNQLIGPRYNYSAVIAPNSSFPNANIILPILGANQTWQMNSNQTAIQPYTLPTSGIAPAADTYVTQANETATLPNSFQLLGTTNQISLTTGTNQLILGIPNNPIMPGNAGMGIPEGTTGQRVIPGSNISLRYNTTLSDIEYYNGTTWIQLSSVDLSGLPILLETSNPDVPNGYVLTAGSGVTLTPTTGVLTISATATGGTVTSVGTNNGLTGGPITTTGTLGLAPINSLNGLVNITGGSAIPSPTTLSAWMDAALGNTQGNIIYRNATSWVVLPPGSAGDALVSGGPAANVSWGPVPGTGTVTSVATNNGLTGGTITTSGTLGLATIPTLNILSNITGGTAIPLPNTLTATIDAAIGSTQGDILYRNASVWTVLAPGTSGNFLQTQGAGANPIWAAGSAGISKVTSQFLSASGTYTPVSGFKYGFFWISGSGGSGAGANGSAGQASAGGGGGPGGIAYAVLTAAQIGASQVFTAGAAVTGGVGAADGSNGNASSLGTLLVAGGGLAGGHQVSTASAGVAAGGGSGLGTTGDVLSGGTPGTAGLVLSGVGANFVSGNGGSNIFGIGGIGNTSGANGANASGHGGGGAGATSFNGAGNATGGSSTIGCLYVIEFS